MGDVHWQRVESCGLGAADPSGFAEQDEEAYLHESTSDLRIQCSGLTTYHLLPS